jgi:uncharacterized protein (DUF1800 family)
MTRARTATIAANRFGLGARPRELEAIGHDPKGWLLAQVERPAAPSATALPSSRDILQSLQEARIEKTQDVEGAQAMLRASADTFRAQAMAAIRRAVDAEDSFHERLVRFWSNHFAVSADKAQTVALAATLEYEAIRPNVSGRFADLLLAVERHPAMLLYLDNQRSVGPRSPAARFAARRRERAESPGLNENLAREILELHTLGVEGGYTQADVTAFAGVLTGWSVGGGPGRLAEGEPGTFEFRELIHEPGDKVILGRRYREDGIGEGERVLSDLARHPATADFIAVKLARHFVSDDPPAAMAARLATVFRDSDGDLPQLYAALIDSPEAWQAQAAKFKTPQEYVISSLRAFGFAPQREAALLGSLELLGQRPYTPGSPAGWPDTARHWLNPSALMARIEWAQAVSRRVAGFVDPIGVMESTIAAMASDATLHAVAAAESAEQGLTLLLASPEFQRR